MKFIIRSEFDISNGLCCLYTRQIFIFQDVIRLKSGPIGLTHTVPGVYRYIPDIDHEPVGVGGGEVLVARVSHMGNWEFVVLAFNPL